MGDFAVQSQDFNRVTIGSQSLEAAGNNGIALGYVGGSTSVAWASANRAIYVPFVVQFPWLVSQLFCGNGAVASGNFDIGVYDTFGNRLASTGSTAQAGTSVLQLVNITDFTLYPGVYYMALAMDGTTGTALRGVGTSAVHVAAIGGLSQASAFPLPNPATFAAAADVFIPLFGLTGRSF